MSSDESGARLAALLEAMTGGKESKWKKLKTAMLAAGYTDAEYKTFGTLYEGIPAFTDAGATATALAEHTDHVPSAECALALAKYMRGASIYLHNVLTKSGIDPKEWGVRHPDEFSTGLDQVEAIANRAIAKARTAQELAG